MRVGLRVPHNHGFTLIELLVVLVILGTLIGLSVMSAGIAGPSRALKQEAERLSGLMGLLVDEAQLTHQEFGLYLLPEGYQVVQLAPDGLWRAYSREHRLAADATLSYRLVGQTLPVGAPNEDAALTPAILLLSNGELSAFELTLSERQKNGQRYRLVSDGFNVPTVESVP